MKKISVIILLLLAIGIEAQRDSSVNISPEKIKRNELGVNVMPFLNLLSDATPHSQARMAVNYRRYLSESKIFRLSLAVFPFKDAPLEYGQFSYATQKDTFYIYRSVVSRQSPKVQLNLGFEKIIASKRLIHSVGADLGLGYQHFETDHEYSWLGQSSTANPCNTTDMNGAPIRELLENKIDTMGYKLRSDGVSAGLTIFYNLRIPLTKKVGVSVTAGPYINFTVSTFKHEEIKTKEKFSGSTFDFDGTPLFVSDLSLYVRF